MKAQLDVFLVGLSPTGAECLGLEYIAAALLEAGHRPHVLTFRSSADVSTAAQEVSSQNPSLVGISLLSGASSLTMIAFASRLRSLGYRGHLTCGGTFATLARNRLLETYPSLDSIIRHDGEVPMVALADALSLGDDLSQVSGLTTREGDGLPAPVESFVPLALTPHRSAKRKAYAGTPSAVISATRGCFGSCRYCGLKGLRREALAEACRAGLDGDALRKLSIGGLRRRSVESVADEMASLYHELGVRFFHFVDENFLPRDHEEAVVAVKELDAALAKRKVGKRAISMMLRADAVTPAVVRALQQLGLVRSLLGVESTTADGLRQLGRGARCEDNLRAMNQLVEAEVSFHFNLMLIHPESTLEHIERELEELPKVHGGLLDPFQVEVYEGTDLFNRLRNEGRLEGGPLFWHCWPEEEGARRFAHLFYRLRHESFGTLHMTAFAYEVLGAFVVARRLGRLQRHSLDRLTKSAGLLVEAHNALWISLLKEALALSLGDAIEPTLAKYLHHAKIRSAHLTLRFERLRQQIERMATAEMRTEIFYPMTARAVAVALAILGANACGPVSTTRSDADEIIDADVPADAEEDPCERYGSWNREEDINQALSEAFAETGESCEEYCQWEDSEFSSYQYVLDSEGHVIDIVTDTGVTIDEELKSCFIEALAGQTFPCPEVELWHECFVLLS